MHATVKSLGRLVHKLSNLPTMVLSILIHDLLIFSTSDLNSIWIKAGLYHMY